MFGQRKAGEGVAVGAGWDSRLAAPGPLCSLALLLERSNFPNRQEDTVKEL